MHRYLPKLNGEKSKLTARWRLCSRPEWSTWHQTKAEGHRHRKDHRRPKSKPLANQETPWFHSKPSLKQNYNSKLNKSNFTIMKNHEKYMTETVPSRLIVLESVKFRRTARVRIRERENAKSFILGCRFLSSKVRNFLFYQ